MTNKEIYYLLQQKTKNNTQMQVKIFLIICFLRSILIDGQCGSIAPSIGSGSYFLQAGFFSLTPSDITDFHISNSSITKSLNVNLKYSMVAYELCIGFKKMDWQFDNNQSINELSVFNQIKTSVSFTIYLYSTFGPSLFDLEVSYLAVDSSLNSFIHVCSGSNYFAIWTNNGTVLPENYTTTTNYNFMSWSGFKNTTQIILYCPYLKYNPALSTANHSLGIYQKLTTVSLTDFLIDVVIPFGLDELTQYNTKVVYFNPDQLFTDKNIILNVVFLSIGDQLTVKTLNTTFFYTNTFIAGQGCDMEENNTFLVLGPYLAAYQSMNFQYSVQANNIFVTAQNYYVYNFSVIHFCSMICTISTNPFLYKVDNQCYDACPFGYYGNTTTNFCELCQLNCSTCQNTQTNCTSCVNGSFLFDNTCVLLCPATTYANSSVNQCLSCTQNCLNCQESATNCTSCLNNYFFYKFNCISLCPLGYYGNNSTLTCEICQTYCSNCSSLTSCFNCSNMSFLYNLDCLLTCPSTTYGNTLLHQCLPCTGNCLECNIKSTNCTSCINNTFYLYFSCYYDCPVRYYENSSTGNCQSCFINCFTCISIKLCTKCISHYFLSPHDINNTFMNKCHICNGTCYNCDYESTNCTSCISHTFFLHFDCYYICPAGYYGNISTGNCQICFLNCSTCTAVNVCTQCISNHFLWPNLDRCDDYCPPNYFPNFTIGVCQRIIIQGCISALYFNGHSICLQCDVSYYLKYVPHNKSCVCKSGYKLNNETCQEYCGDGIVNNMPCDDGNFVNGDGCSSQCLIQNNFNCFSVSNGPTLKSKCSYLPEINLQILSQIKIDGQNTLKLAIKINPAPLSLTSDQIKQFLNLKIENDVVNMSNLQIIYKDGIAQIYIPFTKDIQDKKLSLWTNFDPSKFSSSNILISSILKGDNVALLYSSDLTLYKVIGTFNFSMAIFVCIFALLASFKHKMIGLELIMPFQIILFSQSFYQVKTLQTSVYTFFHPVSFSIFTSDQNASKNNAWYKIGMTGGFLENYNLLGLIFLISTILLIICIYKLQQGQRKRFKQKKTMSDWLNFVQFKILIRQYQQIVWKYFFVSFCLSTIPLIFSFSSKTMTALPTFQVQTLFKIINDKCNYLFYLLFIGALLYTSIPKIFYNSQQSLLKKLIFKREEEKFKYNATYCMYFQLHYLFIGLIFAYCPSTLPSFYTVSALNGFFFLYLIFQRPYQSTLDYGGALFSSIIVVYFLTLNLFIKIAGTSSLIMFLSKISSVFISLLLVIQCLISVKRLIIFWKNDKEQNLKSLITNQKSGKFQYQRDKAYNKYVQETTKVQEDQFKNMMNIIQGEMILNKSKAMNQQLIDKIQRTNAVENQEQKNSILDFMITKQKKKVVSQQRYQTLKRVKKNLRQSFKKYKLQRQQIQRGITGLIYQNTNYNQAN